MSAVPVVKSCAPVVLDGAPREVAAEDQRAWSPGVVVALLRLAAQTSGFRDAVLVPADGEALSATGDPVAPDQARRWLAAAADAGGVEAVEAADGAVLVPVLPVAGSPEAALVLREAMLIEPGHLERAESFAMLLGTLLRPSSHHQSRQGAYEALVQIGTELQAQEIDEQKVFQLIIEHARKLLGTGVAWLTVVDEEIGRMWVKVATGVTTPEFMLMEVELGAGIGGRAIREGRPVIVPDHRASADATPSSVHRTLDGEGIVSILCAPLVQDNSTVGALYVGTRARRDFGTADASLLSALAAQAAVAIRNARIYHRLSEQNDTLKRTFTIHRLLTDASLEGAGMDHVAFELAGLIERDVVVSIDGRAVRRNLYRWRSAGERRPEPVPADEEPAGFVAEVSAGRVGLGTVIAVGSEPVEPIQRNAVEYGATIIALELVKEQAALEVEWRLQGEMLEEMLKAGDPCDGLRARADRLGINLERPRRVAVLQPGPSTAATSLVEVVRRTLRHCEGARDGLLAQRGDRLIVAVPDDEEGRAGERFFERLTACASAASVVFSGGIGESRRDLQMALRQAESALALGASTGRRETLLRYDALGPLRFLLDAPDTTEMVSVVRSNLGALAAKDASRKSDLLTTLRIYLETGGHQPTTAERCHIHVSTLKYRLGRISDALGRPLADPAVRFELGLAFAILRILDLLDVDPFAD